MTLKDPSSNPPVWVHTKGGRYWLLGFCIIERNLQPGVMYQSIDDGSIWVREADEFFDGRFRQE